VVKQAIPLRRKSEGIQNIHRRILGRVQHGSSSSTNRSDEILAILKGESHQQVTSLQGYAAIVVEQGADTPVNVAPDTPLVVGVPDLDKISEGSVIAISTTGDINTLYRPESRFNAVFATGACNSNCLMCSQPPVDDHIPSRIAENLRLIDLIKLPPESLGITGGEPTLLGDGLVEILGSIKSKLPETAVTMLTNGRRFTDQSYVRQITEAAPHDFLVAIPLYADTPAIHDWVVQAKGAFAETTEGLYNTARYGMHIEIRVVLHKQTIPRLVELATFIYRNLPFVSHIALMGLENMGYVKKNWDDLWIDPVDYSAELIGAVKQLHYRGMNVSIYNLPLCVVPSSIRRFARQSISDYKNIYLDECSRCALKSDCSGLFSSSQERHSIGIHAIYADA
jgi:His-Xaa-Ser system radical SAM maturase HxsC